MMRALSAALPLLIGCQDGADVNEHFNVLVDDAVMPVLVRGNLDAGTVVLYVQGGPGLPSIDGRLVEMYGWEDTLEREAAFAYYDARGTGNALGQIDPADLTLEQAAEDLGAIGAALRYRLDFERLVILSHSYGGTVAVHALAEGHADADAWINVDGAMSYDTAAERAHRHAFLVRVSAQMIDAGDTDPVWEEIRQWTDDNPVVPDTDEGKAELSAHLDAVYQRVGEAEPEFGVGLLLRAVFLSHYNVVDSLLRGWAFMDLYDTLRGTDHYDVAERVTVPTLHVVGEYDDIVPVEEAESTHEAMVSGDSALVVIEGANHSPFFDQPAVFAEVVADFLGELDRSATDPTGER